jgi:hypothetical protein
MTRRNLLRNAGTVTLAMLGGGALVACRQEPIYTTSNASFISGGGMTTRAQQIRRAGASLGWRMQDIRPGVIRAVYTRGSHQAVVDVVFDPRTFSIRYVSSLDLNYDGAQIHPTFNGWVRNLEQAIIRESAI